MLKILGFILYLIFYIALIAGGLIGVCLYIYRDVKDKPEFEEDKQQLKDAVDMLASFELDDLKKKDED